MNLEKNIETKLETLWQLPEVRAMKGQMQNEFHKFDVYGHTKEVFRILNEMNSPYPLLAASILHDIGKIPAATIDRDENGKMEYVNGHISYSFHGHEEKGKEMILAMPSKLFSDISLEKEEIAEIVGNHYLIMAHTKKIKKI